MYAKGYLQRLERRYQDWKENTLKKGLERFGVKESPNKFYTPLDIKDDDFLEKVGFPGEYPFPAGINPSSIPGSGPVTGGWYLGGGGGLIRAGRYLGYGTAEDTREYSEAEIARGRTGGPNLAFDLPTQVGLDSDDPMSRGEVGRTGVAIDTLADLEIIYEPFKGDYDLDKIASNGTINATANIILAMYIALAEKRGIQQSKLRGTFQNDILKEFFARGAYIFPPRPSMRMVRDTIIYCTEKMPLFNTVSISGIHMRDGGASRVQTLAFTLCDAIAYLQLGVDAGLDVDVFIKRFTFNTLGGGMEILKEIATRRAQRRMWAKIVRERFGAKDPRSWILREAGGYMVGDWMHTKQRPMNNLTRSVLGGVAGALVGYIPSVEPPFDEPLGLGWSVEAQQLSEDAARIIQYEAKLTEVQDPFAGSYYMEAMTDQIEKEAWELIGKVDAMGGAMAAIENGFIQKEIARSAYEFQRKIETGEEIVVGVNSFTGEQELEVMPARMVPHPYDPQKRAEAEKRQIAKLARIKKERDNRQVEATLKRLQAGAQDEKVNLMPLIVDAVKAYATVGEICRVLRGVFGEYVGYGSI